MILQRTIDTYAGLYKFAVTGGAIGSYDLQVPMPRNTAYVEFMVYSNGLASATNTAQISFDAIVLDTNPNTVFVGSFLAATVITSINIGAPIFGTFGNTNMLNPSQLNSATLSIGMSISVEALTAGDIQFYMRGISFDFRV